MGRRLDKDEALGWGPVRINAGDAATVLYESPFSDGVPYKLWQYKLKKWPRPPATPAMESGKITEPLIAEWYRAQVGFDGEAGFLPEEKNNFQQAWYAYEGDERIQGKADWWTESRRHLAEFKSPTKDDSQDHLVAREDHIIPYHYALQCWHLMEVFDAATMDFVSWRSKDDNVILQVKRNTDFWLAEMLPPYMDFLDWLEGARYPALQGLDETNDEEWAMNARRYIEGKGLEREAERMVARARAYLQRNARAKTTIGGGIKASWSEYQPRYEIKVSVNSQAQAEWVEKQLAPLKQRGCKVWRNEMMPNRVLRISLAKDSDESEPEGR